MSEYQTNNIKRLMAKVAMDRRKKRLLRWWWNAFEDNPTTFVLGWIIVAVFTGIALAQIGMKFGWWKP